MSTRVLIFLSHYLPGYKAGGPLQSIANLVDQLGDEFDFRIVTRDRDVGDREPYESLDASEWHQVGKAKVRYLAPSQLSLWSIARLLRETPHDIVYFNSFFDPRFTTLPLFARRLKLCPAEPAILAPRGEFSAGALKLNSAKKRAFFVASQCIRLHSNLFWQASTAYEADDIRRTIRSKAHFIRIAPNLPRFPGSNEIKHQMRNTEDPLRIVFLSRISPKKNLLFALRVLETVQTPVILSIYGPQEDKDYWDECALAISRLPKHIGVRYCGALKPAEVISVLSQHDLFFLPTLGENYGHVIVEALQAGLPILISDQTPWRALGKYGVGQDLPLGNKQAFSRYIDDFAQQSPDQVSKLRQRIKEFLISHAKTSDTASAYRALFSIERGQ